jgi:hypothetical protein
MRIVLAVLLVGALGCGGGSEREVKLDCDVYVAKLRECPVAGMSSDPVKRDANLEYRLGLCKAAVAAKPTETDMLGYGMERREARCGSQPTCDAFHACLQQAEDLAVDEATRKTMGF